MTDTSLALETREGLPDALRVLLADHPRESWERDPNFSGLVAFWLERHLMFRRLLAMLRAETEALIDRRLEAASGAPRLARIGGLLLGELDGHHRIEDAHYFPVLACAEPRIARGFDLLEADHEALEAELAAFAGAANGLLRALPGAGGRDAAGRFLARIDGLGKLLDRHLTDEEDLVVPVILRHGEGALG
jgi:hypothetical protein